MTTELTTPVINISERLSEDIRGRITTAVTEVMRRPENDSGGSEAWRQVIGPNENFVIGQLTHPEKTKRASLLQVVTWNHPAAPKEIRGLDQSSRKALGEMFVAAATAVWGDGRKEIFKEGFNEDRTDFDPAKLQHNFFAYAGAMIAALQAEKLLPEAVNDQTEEVIKNLPLFERIFAKIRREGSAIEVIGAHNLREIVEMMVPPLENLEVDIATDNQEKGIGVGISIKNTKNENKFEGVVIRFILGAGAEGKLISAGANSYDDSNLNMIYRNALKLFGIRDNIMGKVSQPHKFLTKTLSKMAEKRGLEFNGLSVKRDGNNLVFNFNGKVK